ncbi:aldo/keto reductase [Sphingomonas ginkgonis]|uniref:Aldo/keto reductase n=1 Tax=Sphingomonas ginkgonis TaxID=2315330 RepID=A0A429VC20_9SPHN|nr:aldo/keto reductase [Sphingomonas ginkgonis]RST31530.1 aldo/keto reductase [Sphingomonas ginkgonis]
MIALPRLGMGCAGIGNLYRAVADAVAEDTVAAALEGGIGYFDVAPHYGFGMAEDRLGRALALHNPDQRAIVATKVGRLLDPTDSRAAERHGFVDAPGFEPRFDYSHDGVLRSVEESRRRLRRERIDVLLAHDLGALTHGADHQRQLTTFLDGGYRALSDLKADGAVGAIGIGVNELAVCHELLDRVPLDVILLAGRYTLLEPDRALPLLDRCADTGTRVIIGGPYNSGILVEGSRSRTAHFDYGTAPLPVVAATGRLETVAREFGIALPAAALQFPLRHPQVASVIPGLVGRAQVEATLDYEAAAIPADFWRAAALALSAEPAL